MPACAVATCSNYSSRAKRRKGSNIQYHRFPREKDIRRHWIYQCRREDTFNVDGARLCSAHFTHEDYERDEEHEVLGLQPRKRLKQTAIPSLNLPVGPTESTKRPAAAATMKMASTPRPFFSSLEKDLIISLVENLKQIVECKETDRASQQKKENAWKYITMKFNSQVGVTVRSQAQLKKCWSNLKTKAKKEVAQERREQQQITGGSEPLKASESSLRVLNIVPLQMTSSNNDNNVDHESHEQNVDIDLSQEDAESNVVSDTSSLSPENATAQIPWTRQSRASKINNFRSRQRLTAAQTTLLQLEGKRHKLQMQVLKQQKAFQQTEHEQCMEILKEKAEYVKLKLENAKLKRKINEIEERFWETNLTNILRN